MSEKYKLPREALEIADLMGKALDEGRYDIKNVALGAILFSMAIFEGQIKDVEYEKAERSKNALLNIFIESVYKTFSLHHSKVKYDA